MTKEKFHEFWKLSKEWFNTVGESEDLKAVGVDISKYCSLAEDCEDDIYEAYINVRQLVKELYFKDPSGKKLNKFKRASVIAYIINIYEPLNFSNDRQSYEDKYFLKQRLALYMALQSIIIEYPEELVSKLNKPIFQIRQQGKPIVNGDDDFYMSICKDMFFSVIFKNYNVLTMANLFESLVKGYSNLNEIPTIDEWDATRIQNEIDDHKS